MADSEQNNGSLAMLRAALGSKPLDVSPAPAAMGINPIAGLFGQAVKSYQSYQLRNKAIELLDREALAQKFDQIANDPRYDRDLQVQAEQHGNALRLLHPDDKLDKQYQPDKKDRTVPALNRILYQWHQRETAKRGGEPPPPPEPDEPAEPPPPAGMGMMPTADSSGSGGAGAGADASGVGAAMPAMPAQPGGVQLGPNQITPAPAIPGGAGGISGAASGPPPPPPPPAPDYTPPGPGLPPGMSQLPAGIGPAPGPDYDLTPSRRNDIEQAQRGAQIAQAAETRHLNKLQAATLFNIDPSNIPDTGVDIDANGNLTKPMATLGAANIRANVSAASHGLVRGPDGKYIESPDQPPEIRIKAGALNQRIAYQDAMTKWRTAKTVQDKQIAYARLQMERSRTAAMYAGIPPSTAGSEVGGVGLGTDPTKNSTQFDSSAAVSSLPGVDGGTAALVKQMLDYKLNPTTLPRGQRMYLLRLAAQADPSYDETQFASRNKLRADFTSGRTSQQIKAINTLVGHLQQLKERGAALQNLPIPVLNSIKNLGLNAIGDPRVKRYMEVVKAVAGEKANVFKATGATDPEIAQWLAQASSSDSPEQINGVIEQAIELMNSRLNAINDQWTGGMGRPRDFQILQPRSRAILQQLGVEPDALDPVMGAGATGATGDSSIPPPPAAEGQGQPRVIPAAAYDDMLKQFPKRAPEIKRRFARGQ